jgi:non-homologous end joining protein Ku
VVDLMEALEASVKDARDRRTKTAGRSRRKKAS